MVACTVSRLDLRAGEGFGEVDALDNAEPLPLVATNVEVDFLALVGDVVPNMRSVVSEGVWELPRDNNDLEDERFAISFREAELEEEGPASRVLLRELRDGLREVDPPMSSSSSSCSDATATGGRIALREAVVGVVSCEACGPPEATSAESEIGSADFALPFPLSCRLVSVSSSSSGTGFGRLVYPPLFPFSHVSHRQSQFPSPK